MPYIHGPSVQLVSDCVAVNLPLSTLSPLRWRWSLTVGHSLLVTHCWSLTVGHSLLVTHCWSLTVGHSLATWLTLFVLQTENVNVCLFAVHNRPVNSKRPRAKFVLSIGRFPDFKLFLYKLILILNRA